jgi:hypothetical protein
MAIGADVTKKTANPVIAIGVLGRRVAKELTIKITALFIFLLITVASGCSSVISHSESFYRDISRRPINWREYLTD